MKFRNLSVILFVIVCLISQNNAYKILGVFASASKSHFLLGSELMKSLAASGHEVTMISSFPLKKPVKNYRDIPLTFNVKDEQTKLMGEQNFFQEGENFGLDSVKKFFTTGLTITEKILSDANLQKLLNSNEHFDAVITVAFTYEATYAIASHFKAPLIVYSTVGASILVNELVGNPNNYAYVPDLMLGFTDRMSFKERAINTIVNTMFDFVRYFYYLPEQYAITKKYFPNGPDLYEIMKKTSLVFINSHVSVSYPRPFVPNMIEIAGHHVQDPKPLPADLQKFMDDAKQGVIYFSLGSNVRSSDLGEKRINEILKVFSKLPQKIIWKWETDTLPGQPKNVLISKWLPQNDILAHPNLKLFITHGGWCSTVESIVRGVPLIGIPALADQLLNMRKAEQQGLGILLDFKNITETSFSWALNELLNNPKYKNAMKETSKLFLDREIKPVDRAIYWVEHVIRNKGAHHLQSAAVHLTRPQLILLDVVAFFGAILLVILLTTYFTCRFILRKLCKLLFGNSNSKKKTD
ncbi:UDP-glycosyltransferase UGT5-like [Chrysoperla carnea]|uniref:UDP-glycosyltransferase UGT5-like n=1 Tax=Chrysoperla carnea TaxID=189513 RepID=UPI001D0993C2|nr:UDP-glycosyltransferase UGT5-like [Chrysoperla carnea]